MRILVAIWGIISLFNLIYFKYILFKIFSDEDIIKELNFLSNDKRSLFELKYGCIDYKSCVFFSIPLVHLFPLFCFIVLILNFKQLYPDIKNNILEKIKKESDTYANDN